MSLRKPILKVTRECSTCKSTGRVYIKLTFPSLLKKGYYEIKIIDCKKCKGIGRIDIKQNHLKFKKYYQKALEERVDDLTIEYRNAKEEAHELGEELSKYSKELDKIVNK